MFDRFAEARDELKTILADAGKALADTGSKTDAEEFSRLADCLSGIRYQVAVLGFMKRGKSTLVNALLRRADDDIAPVATLPCSSIITRYNPMDEAHPTIGAQVHFLDPKAPRRDIPLERIREFNTEKGNPGNAKGVRHIDVYADFPVLNQAACLVDTPGKGSIHAAHDAIVDEFLPAADAVILPISSDLPIEAGEKKFLKDVFSGGKDQKDRVFVVITKTDELSTADRCRVGQWVETELADTGLRAEKLYWTAAKPVFEMLKAGKPEVDVKMLTEKWGLLELEKDLEDHIVQTSSQAKVFARQVRNIMSSLSRRCSARLADIDIDIERLGVDREKLETEKRQKEVESKRSREEFKKKLSRFKRDWDRAWADFKRTAQLRSDAVSDRIQEQMENDNLLAAFQRKPTVMAARSLNAELAEPGQRLTEKLETAAACLDEDFDEILDVYAGVRRKRTDRTATMAKTGIAALLMGGGLFAAGKSIVAVTQVAAALTAWQAAAASGATAVAAAKAETGVLAAFWAWLAGGGKVATTLTATSTATTAAASTAVASAVAATLTCGGAILAAFVAVKATNYIMTGIQIGRVPNLVSGLLDEMLGKMEGQLNIQRDRIIELFEARMEDEIEVAQKRIDEILAALDQNDPVLLESRKKQKAALLGVMDRKDAVERRFLALGLMEDGATGHVQ